MLMNCKIAPPLSGPKLKAVAVEGAAFRIRFRSSSGHLDQSQLALLEKLSLLVNSWQAQTINYFSSFITLSSRSFSAKTNLENV